MTRHRVSAGQYYEICPHCGIRNAWGTRLLALSKVMKHNKEKHSDQKIAFVEHN